MLESLLIANRGEIAVRIIRACRDLGIRTVLAASSIDATDSLGARLADQVVRIGGPHPRDSYLNLDAVLAAARATRVDGLHPGYGFLSENPRLAEGCASLGIAFVGPSVEAIERVGNKAIARELAASVGVPVLAGELLAPIGLLNDADARSLESSIGYPLLIKAVHGGGGRGMRLVSRPADLLSSAAAAAAEATGAFGSPELYVEHWVRRARHLEVQILGAPGGKVSVIGDRDCSVQRRHQKLIEEAPAGNLSDSLRASLHDSARRIAEALDYVSAGTVEFVLDAETNQYFFLEVNARLQVEHPVTEATTGIDIVRCQLQLADEGGIDLPLTVAARGSAIECRVNAEWPERDFQPSPGRIATWKPPTFGNPRVDSHCFAGYSVPPFYDSMIAKLITFGQERSQAIAQMTASLESFEITGIKTTIPWLTKLVASKEFETFSIHTRWVDEISARPDQPDPLL